jgi:hypothetical protein
MLIRWYDIYIPIGVPTINDVHTIIEEAKKKGFKYLVKLDFILNYDYMPDFDGLGNGIHTFQDWFAISDGLASYYYFRTELDAIMARMIYEK